MDALHMYRVSYQTYLRGKWHPDSVGGMGAHQAERVAHELRTAPTPGYRNVKITNDYLEDHGGLAPLAWSPMRATGVEPWNETDDAWAQSERGGEASGHTEG